VVLVRGETTQAVATTGPDGQVGGLALPVVLAAAAAAWALGLPPELIRTGIDTFDQAAPANGGANH
jgi:phosphoenolpyruvate carboxylase